MDRGEPANAPAFAAAGALAAFNRFRIAAGIAATIGLVAGEVLSELRQRRAMPVRRRR
jgi:hypothetical protein